VLRWLGKKWDDVKEELTQESANFCYEITSPVGKAVPCGDLRVARISCTDGYLKFILIHDRFIR